MNQLAQLIPLLFVLALGLFAWGAAMFFTHRTDEAERGKAKKKMLWGIAAFVVLIFFWGFVGYTQQSLGLTGALSAPMAPSINAVPPMFGNGAPRYAVDEYSAKSAEMNYGAPSRMPPIPNPTNNAPAGEAKIVKTATIRLVVESVDTASEAITALRMKLGGQPGNASFSRDAGGRLYGQMTISVPSTSFDAAIEEIKKLGKQVNEVNITATDVSAQFVDLESRLRNLRAAETQYVELMKRSGKISEVLEVTRALNDTRMQIEQLQGQLNHLSNQVALSAITVILGQEASVVEAKNEWKPLSVFKASAKASLQDLTNFIDDLTRFFVSLPVLLLKLAYYLLVFWVIWKVGKFAYRKVQNAFPGLNLPGGGNKV